VRNPASGSRKFSSQNSALEDRNLNARSLLWPDLPPEAFSSSGAGGHYFTVFAGAELVVVQNPGRQHRSDRGDMANPELLRILLDACG